MPQNDPRHFTGAVADVESVRRRAAAIVRASGMRRPPFFPERYAARCGVSGIISASLSGAEWKLDRPSPDGRPPRRARLFVDRRLPPHTPQWNGAVALGLGETLAPADAGDGIRGTLAEAAAAELLLPMPVFRPAAARTDLTVDGLRDLAARFAAPLRLTARQWLASRLWHGFALLWRDAGDGPRLWWRAASTPRVPDALALGAGAAEVWAPESRLFATLRTGRTHHGVEQVRLGTGNAWWFVRFAAVRDPADAVDAQAPKAVLAMVMLAHGSARRPRAARAARGRGSSAEGITSGFSN